MQDEVIFKTAFGVMAVLILCPIGYVNHRAQREHGSRFAQAANEYPPLLWVRGVLAIPVYAALIDWLFSAHWFPWAVVPLPPWTRWTGVGLAGVVAGLLWWTLLSLGSNYRGTMGLHPNHTLITHGPYRMARHPMNAVFPFIAVVLFLLSANWLAGAPALALLGTVSIVRTRIEERQLIERFGDEYRAYAQRTGRLFPRLRRRGEGPSAPVTDESANVDPSTRSDQRR